MSEILEICDNSTYRIGGLEIQGDELKHHLANGLRYVELSKHMKDGVINE